MSKFHKSYRIRTEVGKNTNLHVKLDNDYNVLKIMSLEIDQENAYKLHSSNYGVIAGRVLANEAFGIPNAKISVFINIDNNDVNDVVKSVLYPYNTTISKNKDDVRYNLLVDEQLSDCHTSIGTFPEKQYLLDNGSILEVFEKYYKYTTRTNESGDYMIFGVPVGSQTIHVDIDLSDIGILSQTPRDMIYKGYNVERFENSSKFKYDTNLDSLVQVITQNEVTDVIPFWGDDSNTSVGITRCDINIEYKFEPTCVFMGSVVSDNSSNGISKKCIPTPGMGSMEELTTGSGRIEMIRKTPSGGVEEFQIKGNQLINGDGVWCYQIPMNLDYVKTDEYGNTVPTDDPKKGIPTRTRVRFRMSLEDFDNDNSNIFRCKVLVPHNPDVYKDKNSCQNEVDYQFGTNTKEDSYKDLFWNGVYSVKSYIPRIQKGSNWKNEKFTGFKRINYHGSNNPVPYNNIRIKIPLMYTLLCLIFKMIIKLIGFLNRLFSLISRSFVNEKDEEGERSSGSFLTFSGEMCDENMSYLCVIPGISITDIASKKKRKKTTMLGMTFLKHLKENDADGNINKGDLTISSFEDKNSIMVDEKSIDNKNGIQPSEIKELTELKGDYVNPTEDNKNENEKKLQITITGLKVTDSVNYLVQCIEMSLAQEYKVIQFDFYNDWINGMIYIPRWMRKITKKRTFLWGAIKIGGKVKACNEEFIKSRNIVQQCGLSYEYNTENKTIRISNGIGCGNGSKKLKCHKSKNVRKEYGIFGSEKGVVKSIETIHNQYVYYFKPCELSDSKNVRLFSTDIILLGTLNDCDKWGIPNDLTELYSSTYQMPPNMALTDSSLEGNLYEAKHDEGGEITFTFNNKKELIGDIVIGDKCYLGDGISPMSEEGNYTEMSGIDWGYTGPLQKTNKSTEFYKPGGHFLGISCRNSETTIKTCVNLSRICEHGVLMSQRHELNIPNSDKNFKSYATIPSGLISKDEISDTDYRRIFSSMNKNRLKTVIDDENGFPIYNFEYVNPTNFNGELQTQVKDDSNMNYYKTDKVTEKIVEYNDDDYYFRSIKTGDTIREHQIIRTGEYTDTEYLKFRFGLTDEDLNDSNKIRKRFLLNNGISLSMPVYDNSFYFYFGLRDGKTALDEFKKTFYANCNKMDSLTQEDNSIKLSNISITYAGIEKNNGSVSFNISTTNKVFSSGLSVSIKKQDGSVINTVTNVVDYNTLITFNNLEIGDYIINVTSNNDYSVNESLGINIKSVEIYSSINGVNFNTDISNLTIKDVFTTQETKYDGYITITNNCLQYNNENGIEEYDIFGNCVEGIYIVNDDEPEEGEDDYRDNIIYQNNINNRLVFCISGVSDTNITLVRENDPKIPVKIPVYKSGKYNVYIRVYLDNNGKLSEDKTNNIHEIFIGSANIDNGTRLDFLLNGMPYYTVLKPVININYGDEDSFYGAWWASGLNGGISLDGNSGDFLWNLKNTLYLDSLNKPKSISMSLYGGNYPYNESLICMKEDKERYLLNSATYTDTTSILSDIRIPTINFLSGKTDSISDAVRRKNFKYSVTDSKGATVPSESYFTFPIIYKPFFIETGIWYLNSENKFFLNGNVYNGITWDHENEGFNNVLLNNLLLLDAVDKINFEHDDSYMEFDEYTLETEYGGEILGGYNFTGVTKNITETISNYRVINDESELNSYDKNYKYLVLNDKYYLWNETIKIYEELQSVPSDAYSDVVNRTIILPYFKYNGRKSRLNIELDSSLFNLHANKTTPRINLSVGCLHKENDTTYSSNSICETDTNSGVTFFNYKTLSKTVGIDYFIQMELEKDNRNVNVKHYIVESGDNTGYSYPLFSNGVLSISDKLFRHIIDGRVEETNLINFRDELGYFKVGDENLLNKKIFYISVVNGGGGYNEGSNIVSTNEHSKIKAISVSELIDMESLERFYPMNLYVKIDDFWNESKMSYEAVLRMSGGTENFKNKIFELRFLREVGSTGNYKLLDKITVNTPSNRNNIDIDITSYRKSLEIVNFETDLNYPNRYIRLEYDVYDGNEKAPQSYVYYDMTVESGQNNILISHTPKENIIG